MMRLSANFETKRERGMQVGNLDERLDHQVGDARERQKRSGRGVCDVRGLACYRCKNWILDYTCRGRSLVAR